MFAFEVVFNKIRNQEYFHGRCMKIDVTVEMNFLSIKKQLDGGLHLSHRHQ